MWFETGIQAESKIERIAVCRTPNQGSSQREPGGSETVSEGKSIEAPRHFDRKSSIVERTLPKGNQCIITPTQHLGANRYISIYPKIGISVEFKLDSQYSTPQHRGKNRRFVAIIWIKRSRNFLSLGLRRIVSYHLCKGCRFRLSIVSLSVVSSLFLGQGFIGLE